MSTIIDELENHIVELKRLRDGGMFVKDIAKIYHVNEHTMSAFLVNHGITWRRKILDSDIPIITSLYLSGKSIASISKMYHVTSSKISNLLKSNNIKIRSGSDINRRYTLDETYFDKIDDQNKAYIIGLLIADGNCNGGSVLRLQLQESDKSVLEKISHLLGSNKPLGYVDLSNKNQNHKNAWLLHINSFHIRDRLKDFYIVPQKDFKTRFPIEVPYYLYRHVIRGLLDGDGNICSTEKRCQITGNKYLIDFLVVYIESLLGIHCSNVFEHRSDKTKTMRISGRRQVKKFLDYIYEDANLYIDRKYNLYKSLYCA